MSTLKVEVVQIDEVRAHPNADRLDLVRVRGWECVTGRNNFATGSKCVYIPIDSVLPPELEAVLFPEGSKVKLSKSRVKTARIRGALSQGMVVTLAAVGLPDTTPVGKDVTQTLGVTKWEPPRKAVQLVAGGRKSTPKAPNPHFAKYTDLENIKNYPTVFTEGEPVVVTEKIHGTNFRAGWVPYHAATWWQRVLKWLRLAPRWTFVYGSRNMQLAHRFNPKTYYPTNVYLEAVKKYDLYAKLPYGTVVYGEVYGCGVQKGYTYGCAKEERKLALFEVQQAGTYVGPLQARDLVASWGLPFVPVVHVGAFADSLIHTLAAGPSDLAPAQKVREGVVVRSAAEGTGICGRKILKVINPDYLLSKHADEESAHDQVA